jgi:hypothetical protein
MIIIHHCFVLGQHNSKKSLLLLIIPSINTKSYSLSGSFGISSRAFQSIVVIVFSNFTSAIFMFASSCDFDEKSIVVI